MGWMHPKLSLVIGAAPLVCLLGAAGCRNQPGGMANPFLAPDRVPPPATRTLLPGQAQPYYPGDPLPVTQSAAPLQPSSNDALAWNAPNETAATLADQAEARGLALSNEPSVAVPRDDGDLRFALPSAPGPEPIQPAPVASNAASREAVVPASYNAPLPMNQPAGDSPLMESSEEFIASGPWRSPQIQAPSQPVSYGVPAALPGVPSAMPQANHMDVQLRAVPSPPPEPVEANTPRIRLPGYGAVPADGGALYQVGESPAANWQARR